MSTIWRVALPPPRISKPQSSGLMTRAAPRRDEDARQSAISHGCWAAILKLVPGPR
jgi:hypothetical protein